MISKGDNPFTKYNQLKLYEICYSRVHDTFPRVNLLKPCIDQFPAALKERSFYTVRKNERQLGLTALKELSNEELNKLKSDINFDLNLLFTDELIERLFKEITDESDVADKLPQPIPGSKLTKEQRMIQRMRREYKRRHRIL